MEGRQGIQTLLAATNSPAGLSVQDRMLDLLAGTSQPDTSDTHNQLVEEMIRIFEAQRLISLSSIFDLVDQLESLGKGEKANNALITKTAARISEIQLPRNSLSGTERNALSFGYWSEKHIEAERKLTLRAFIDRAGTDPKKLDEIRALMAPFLRDTLIGFNYVHYAPPGAQVLYTNPLFVRSHDFVGVQDNNGMWKDTQVLGSGWPSSAGGKLVGSLVSLPYALAEAEQNFLIPSREQALIWGDLVPQLLLTATIPRWWNVTPGQLHWVALHMDYAETMLAEAAVNADRRQTVLDALGQYAMPARVAQVRELLAQGEVHTALENVMPSELFAIARDVLAADKADAPLAMEIRREAAESPAAVELRNHLPRLRHAKADAGEFVLTRIARPANVSHFDGLFQPDPGRKLGIESSVLRGFGGPAVSIARRAQCSGSGLDAPDRGADFRHQPGGLAGAAAFTPAGGRRCA